MANSLCSARLDSARRILYFFAVLLASSGWVRASELEAVWPELEERLTGQDREAARRLRDSGAIHYEPSRGEIPASTGEPFRVFVRPPWERVEFNTIPASAECERALEVSAARGARARFTFGIFVLDEALDVEVSIDDLKSSSGSVVAKGAFGFACTKYLPLFTSKKQIVVEPAYLQPGSHLTLKRGVTRQVWGHVCVPESAAAGAYTGKISFLKDGKELASKAITLKVHPFVLAQSADVDFGWFYGAGWAPDKELAQLASYGCNAITFPEPKIKRSEAGLAVDFAPWDEMAKRCKAAGLNGRHLFYALQVGRHLGKKEFSESFNTDYREAMKQVFAWAAKNDVKMIAWVVDEPRERDINPWNRNLADTLKYLELFKDIPGAVTMVSPMRDTQNGLDYTVLDEHMDVLFTHPWEQSKKLIQKMADLKKPFVSYNSVRDRLSFGFGTWTLGARGRWQWHYACGHPRGQLGFDLTAMTVPKSGAARAAFLCQDAPYATPVLEYTAEGINDFWYVRTLEETLQKARAVPALQSAVQKGESVLALIRTQVGQFSDAGALKKGSDAEGLAANPYARSETAQRLREAVTDALLLLQPTN